MKTQFLLQDLTRNENSSVSQFLCQESGFFFVNLNHILSKTQQFFSSNDASILVHGKGSANCHFYHQVKENRNSLASSIDEWIDFLKSLNRVSELYIYFLPLVRLGLHFTESLDCFFQLDNMIMFCIFLVLYWHVFLALVTRKMIWTFVSQAFVETHRELIVTAGKNSFKVLFHFLINVRYLFAQNNIFVIEIFRLDSFVSKLVFQTNFSEYNCGQEIICGQIKLLVFVLQISNIVVAHCSRWVRLAIKYHASLC